MRKRLLVLVMILAVAIFTAPAQNLFAKVDATSCCTTERTSESCHGQQKREDSGCNKDHKTQQGCTGTGCKHCSGCYVFFMPVIQPDQSQKIDCSFYSEKKSDFNYTCPNISTGLQDIWQPPKIA